MRAVLVRELGAVPVVDEHPDPQHSHGGALVRVGAAPVVPLDVLCASGTSYFGRRRTPYVPGVQGVGVVEESDALAAGTRVWFATSAGMVDGDGSLAPWCAVADDDLVPVDADVTDAALAALGLSAVAAWMSLTWRAGLRPGERVLVLGGGGAVGQSAIGAAHVLGAGQVVAVCRSADAAGRATAAGADAVVEHVDDVTELTARLSAACAGPVDVVVDPIFGAGAAAATQVLGDSGRLVTLGGASGDAATFSSATLRSKSISVLGYTNNSISVAQRAEAVTRIAEHAAAGRMQVAHHDLPLDRVAEAWLATAEGRASPRHVLVP
jgi:NADPH:quinone reductase-like Zn-dependent oxidoreductase